MGALAYHHSVSALKLLTDAPLGPADRLPAGKNSLPVYATGPPRARHPLIPPG